MRRGQDGKERKCHYGPLLETHSKSCCSDGAHGRQDNIIVLMGFQFVGDRI